MQSRKRRRLRVIDQIDFIEHRDARNGLRINLLQGFLDGLHLHFALGRRRIDHMQHQIGAANFVERALERLDERRRKFLDEADGIGKRDFAAFGQHELARGRIERGEKLVV